jgi:hypothetical protein
MIGVRSIEGVTWRAARPVPPNKTTALTVTAARNGIALAGAP